MTKCKVIHYGQNNPEYDYVMNNKKLYLVEEECDLVVTFTKDLKFSQHIESDAMTSQPIATCVRHFRR